MSERQSDSMRFKHELDEHITRADEPASEPAGEQFNGSAWIRENFSNWCYVRDFLEMIQKAYAAGLAAHAPAELSYEEGRTASEERDEAQDALAHSCIEYEKVITDLRAELLAARAVPSDVLRELRELSEKATAGPYRAGSMAMTKNDWAALWNKKLVTIDGTNSTGNGIDVLAVVWAPDDVEEMEQARFFIACVNYVRSQLAALAPSASGVEEKQ